MNNNLEIIYGPMFSGKTTKLIEIYFEKISEVGENKCIAFNYAMDKRYTEKSKIVSHDGLSIDCKLLVDLRDFLDNPNNRSKLLNIQYIFINEAQFFPNLLHIVLYLTNILNKNVILCGLDLDYKKEKFGDILDLVNYAGRIHKLTGKCNECNKPSLYSHRTIKFKDQLLIGNTVYIPLCEDCYNVKNTHLYTLIE
tara:strand:- start:290 stop:877 length:588 start_codon:yes stop_codon:yes gene_type:complete